MFEVSFSQASRKVELFPWRRLNSSFWFPPSQGWSSGLCKLCIRWDLCWVFCLFFLWWERLNEVVILSAGDWVCIFVLFVVQTRHPAQGATGDWVMLGLVFKWSVSFVWVLTIWYSLGLVLCWSRVLESMLPLQRLRAWSLVRNKDSTGGLLWHCCCYC